MRTTFWRVKTLARHALLAAATLATAACHREPTPTVESHAVPSSPVPAPEGLVAEACMRGPDALWGRLQHGIAGPLAELPPTIGGVLAAGAALDLTLAGEIDGAAPAYGVVARPGRIPGWLAALKLRDLEHARASLLGGKKPRFSGRTADGGLVVLGASPQKPPLPYLLALSPLGYLVIASSEADLVTLAPYATRTLPTRPPSSHALVVSATHSALASALHDELAAAIGNLRATLTAFDASLRKEHGGRVPDFGDPSAVIQGIDDFAQAKLLVLADLAEVDLTVDAGDDDVDVELALVPGSGASASAFAKYPTGDAAALLTLSEETEAATLFHDDESSLRDAAKSMEDRTVAVFKDGLSAKDTAVIHGAMDGWAGVRGSWMTLAFEDSAQPAFAIRTPSTNPERAMSAVAKLIDLAHLPAFRKVLEARLAVQGVSTAAAQVAGGGAASIATFRRRGSKDGGELAVAWASSGEILRVGAAGSSARALAATRQPDALLGADARLAGKLGTLRDRSAVVLLGRSTRGQDPARARSSVVLALGRESSHGWAMLEADDALVRDAVAWWLDL